MDMRTTDVEHDENLEPALKRQGMPREQANALYKQAPSFVDYLPWVEDTKGAILLEDGVSVGAVFDVAPRGTEGRSEEYLAVVRDAIQDAIQDSFDEFDAAPWVLQTYTFDEPDLSGAYTELADYIKPEIAETEFTQMYLGVVRKHFTDVTKPGGLFEDNDVTKTRWRGGIRKNYLVIYRRCSTDKKGEEQSDDALTPLGLLNEACEKFFNALKPIGIVPRRLTGSEFHQWMQRFFNPSTELFDGDIKQFHGLIAHDEQSLPFGDGFSETLLYNHPRSDFENGCWWFGETAMRCIYVDGFRRRPNIGHTTGEVAQGDAINTMIDQMPEGTVMVSTIVIIPQDSVEAHINAIQKSAIGDSSAAEKTHIDCQLSKQIMSERHKFYRAKTAFYIRAESVKALNKVSNAARATLLSYNFRAIAPKDDVKALDNFISNLPMVYDPDKDKKAGWPQAQLTVVQHLANLSCMFGRGRGTGRPGILAFNRGGEPLTFDPLNKHDRKQNAHMLMFGPTGAGKSATLVSTLANVVAIHRPRMFIIEAGNSFGLLGDWFAKFGLSVNKVSLKPKSGVTLPPFADAAKVLFQDQSVAAETTDSLASVSDEDDDEQRDILGEMEIIAQLMITGGEEKEIAMLRRSDKRLIRDAIIDAAERADAEQRMTLTEDVRQGFYNIAARDDLNEATRNRLREMGDALGLFCDGFEGEVFNTQGKAWPEVDVTIIDLGTFAREGYEAHLAVAVISCLNMINNIAERDQYGEREIVVTIDEGHMITTNVLLAPLLTKISKMWRKLGAWLWIATQNLEDFPNIAKKMLNMMEFWICLVMPKEEVEQIARFKTMDAAKRQLLLSASKSPQKYTEGVVLSQVTEALFRSVPPSICLALAMTEKHEKAERAEIMQEQGISEVDAAEIVAKRVDEARGIAT